jgi:hypothetical protein
VIELTDGGWRVASSQQLVEQLKRLLARNRLPAPGILVFLPLRMLLTWPRGVSSSRQGGGSLGEKPMGMGTGIGNEKTKVKVKRRGRE